MSVNIKYINIIVILLHMLLGYLALTQVIAISYSYVIIATGALAVIVNSNRNEEATIWTAYLVGSEVFLRMTKGLFFHEINKYTVILLLLLGLFVEKKRHNLPPIYIFYLLILLLGIVFTNVPIDVSLRKVIAFNLSGPFLLGISAIYFYKRKFTKEQLFKVLYYAILPMFSMIAYMYFKTPDFKDIQFGGVANATTSGGFGPNQVATMIGFGIFISSIFLFLKKRLSGFLLFDILILVYFTYRGLLTFARGGMFTVAMVIVVFSVIMILGGKNKVINFFKYASILSFLLIGIWLYTSNVTGGMIENRYAGKNARGVQKSDITAGRIAIFQAQLQGFYEKPVVGIGVGGTKYFKTKNFRGITSHDEVGRLISEHGLIGLFLLGLLLFAPLPTIFGQGYYARALLIAFYLFWFLTINHSAMRVAFPGWIYGLSLITITNDDNEDEEAD